MTNSFDDDATVVHNLFGCYLLVCANPQYKGHTYIGFTNNPTRRIGQHNRGCDGGGARRTNGRGPWHMVCIVHGFPNKIAALQFEWAWQNPTHSRHLKNAGHPLSKSKKESAMQHRVRLACVMVNSSPWKRLPLTFRWLRPEYTIALPLELPSHVAIASGQIVGGESMKSKPSTTSDTEPRVVLQCGECSLCNQPLVSRDDKVTLRCYLPRCDARYHVLCLADAFLNEEKKKSGVEAMVPIRGECPICFRDVLWGDVVTLSRIGNSQASSSKQTDQNLRNFDESIAIMSMCQELEEESDYEPDS